MLSAEQILHYNTFGFLVIRGYYDAAEVAEIRKTFDEVLDTDRGGVPFDGKKRQLILGFVERSPLLSDLVDNERTISIVKDLLGDDPVWVVSDGNLYVGDTDWHADLWEHAPEFSHPPMKIGHYLDPVRKDTGALRVIPGSHLEPLHSQLRALQKSENGAFDMDMLGSEIPAYPIESDPGDIVLFNGKLFHSSWGGNSRRSMFALNYAATPASDAEVTWHHKMYASHRKQNDTALERSFHPGQEYLYGTDFLTGGSARRHSLVAPLLEWGFI